MFMAKIWLNDCSEPITEMMTMKNGDDGDDNEGRENVKIGRPLDTPPGGVRLDARLQCDRTYCRCRISHWWLPS